VVAALPGLTTWLQYDRLAIAAGELWRLCSGHWTHVSGEHLFWDVLMFVILGALCELEHRGRCLTCVVGATVLIPAVLWFGMPSLIVYRGLSGIDSALFMLLATTHWRRELQAQHWGWMIALTVVGVLFGAKVVYEAMTGSALFVDSQDSGMIPVPLAHAIGALVGVGVGLPRSEAPTPHHRFVCRHPPQKRVG
jgi:rhomboid family GlyGly-CTERM serine protease